MKYFNVEKFDNTGLVKTIMVPKGEGRWRIYSHDIKADMEDLKYYRELSEKLGITPDDMIRVPQIHTANILIASKEDAGSGVTRYEVENKNLKSISSDDMTYTNGNSKIFVSTNSEGIDGIITNERNILLLTIEADCTPIYILDPVKKVIGMIHSGWRGTVANIGVKAIKLMIDNYGSKVDDILIHFGPAICSNCYEVGIELIDEFKKILSCDDIHKIFKPIIEKNEKYLLDVTEGIRLSFLKIGINEKNITRTDICTYHDNIFDSWRRDKDKTKQMLTGIMLI